MSGPGVDFLETSVCLNWASTRGVRLKLCRPFNWLDKTIGDYELLIGIKADKYDLNIIQSNLLTLIMDKSKVIQRNVLNLLFKIFTRKQSVIRMLGKLVIFNDNKADSN